MVKGDHRIYESVVILPPVLNNDENKEVFNKISKFILDNNGEIIESAVIGLKKMAYKINKYENGYYFYFEFKAIPSFIKNLEVFYKRDERIVRFLVCNIQKEGEKYNIERRKKKGEIIQIIDTSIK